MPRTRAPDATWLAVAITWPVTSGVTSTTPSVERRRAAIVERRDPLRAGLDRDVAVEAEHPAQQLGAKAAHHGQHHDQRADPQHDAQERERRDHRDEAFLPPRTQIGRRSSRSTAGTSGRKPRDGCFRRQLGALARGALLELDHALP